MGRSTALLLDREGRVVSVGARGPALRKLLAKSIGPPCLPRGTLTYIDMQSKANKKLTEALHDGPGPLDNDLRELPRGVQVFAGVEFRIVNAMIQLASRAADIEPARVDGIPVNAKFAKLYILHAASRSLSPRDGTAIGRYEVNYEEGSVATVHVVYGEDLRDWWVIDRGVPVTRGMLAWAGSNPSARRAGKSLRLYATIWENPHPDRKVLSIDYISAMTNASPFCVAMTIEQPPKDKGASKPSGKPDASMSRGGSRPASDP